MIIKENQNKRCNLRLLHEGETKNRKKSQVQAPVRV